jgi:dienelactone hydrolase
VINDGALAETATDVSEAVELAVEADDPPDTILLPSPLAAAYRRIGRTVGRIPGARLTLALPRTADFVYRSWARSRRGGEIPAPAVSVALAAQVAMDETILAAAKGPNSYPTRADYERVSAELAAAHVLFEREGWVEDPASYHRDPPPLETPWMQPSRTVSGRRFIRLSYTSGYAPWPSEPGGDRWLGYVPNHTAYAWLLRHEGTKARPWVVSLHGFGMGYPVMDFFAVQAAKLHRELGYNVVCPVLPLHGPRKVGQMSGDAFLSFDVMNAVHGLAQAAWDVRRLLDWVTRQNPTCVGLYGVSLGGNIAALTCALTDVPDFVLVGIPVSDFPALFASHSPPRLRSRAQSYGLLGEVHRDVNRVVSPLAMQPRVRQDRRFIFAGLGDRMVPAPQPFRLWRHWEEPRIQWYGGNHVGYLWSHQVRQFVDEVFTKFAC